jgi:hypothetical protein
VFKYQPLLQGFIVAIVCFILGIGLTYAAWQSKPAVSYIFGFSAAGNLWVCAHMIATNFPYAFHLMPNPFN